MRTGPTKVILIRSRKCLNSSVTLRRLTNAAGFQNFLAVKQVLVHSGLWPPCGPRRPGPSHNWCCGRELNHVSPRSVHCFARHPSRSMCATLCLKFGSLKSPSFQWRSNWACRQILQAFNCQPVSWRNWMMLKRSCCTDQPSETNQFP